MKTPVFKDRVKIYVNAGNGGDGGAYFRREKFVPFGGPSGGDGGHGGSVFLEGYDQLDSLLDLYFRPHQKAEHGVAGGTKACYGRRGADKVVRVPCGTVILNEDGRLFGEVLEPGDRLCVAKGGRGGLGNIHFKTSSNQAPTECTPGTEGERRVLWLELKSIADVGLVGYPNAGKSTLLSKLTHAHPKVGAYPFTTLNPIIGTLESDDYRKMRIADIPGLIDGAADGVGLGHAFLRHIERTRFLVFVLDMGGEEGRSPLDDFEQLKHELNAYEEGLAERPFVVVANKMDVPEAVEHLKVFKAATGLEPLELCAELGDGVAGLAEVLWASVPARVFKTVEVREPLA